MSAPDRAPPARTFDRAGVHRTSCPARRRLTLFLRGVSLEPRSRALRCTGRNFFGRRDSRMLPMVGRSVRRKLMLVVLATTFAALAVSAIALVAYDLRTYKKSLLDDLATQANILG